MDAPAAPPEQAPDAGTTEAGPNDLATARAAIAQAVRVAEAALALLRAELQLARSSAMLLVWLTLLLVFLGVGAWLAISAAIAAGVYELTGNLFYGIGSVALLNLLGMCTVALSMRACWRDLALPRTRRMLGRIGQEHT